MEKNSDSNTSIKVGFFPIRMTAVEMNKNIGGHITEGYQCIYCFKSDKAVWFYCTLLHEHSEAVMNPT